MSPEFAYQIVSHLTTSVFWFDRDLCLQVVNPAAESLLALSGKKIHGMRADALFPHQAHFVQNLQRAREENAPVREHGVLLTAINGQRLTVDYTAVPLTDPARREEVIVEMINMDQHLRLTREENLLLQQQTVQTVIRGLAHEIKNPLGGLRGAAQLLARELPDPALHEYTDIIIAEADRLQTLLNQLLGPRHAPRKKRINIHQVLFRVSRLVLSEAAPAIRLTTDFDPSIPDLWVDPDQLLQAVLNILRNAIQAMQGQGDLFLRTRIRRKMTLGHRYYRLVAQLDIEDHGPGIPEDLREQIFYPMVSGRPDGSGLGLSIAQTLIHRNGGFISCASEPGCTVFTLWLPLPEEDDRV